MTQSLMYPQPDHVCALWLPSQSVIEGLIKLEIDGIPAWNVLTVAVQTLLMPNGYHATLFYDDCVRCFVDDLHRDPFEQEAVFARNFFSREDQIFSRFNSVIQELMEEYSPAYQYLVNLYPDSIACQLVPDNYVEVRGKCIIHSFLTHCHY